MPQVVAPSKETQMTKPYRWGDVAPPAVQEMQKRRRYRASEFFARLKRGRGEKFDQERSAEEQPGSDGIAETVRAALADGLTLPALRVLSESGSLPTPRGFPSPR